MDRKAGWALAVCLLVGLGAGLWLGGHPQHLPSPIRDLFVEKQLSVDAAAADAIRSNYYKPVNPSSLQNASVSGMVSSLRKRYKDRFSEYFDPRQVKQLKELLSGEFSGVGMTVQGIKRGLRVTSVFAGTPAKRAGLSKGDEIVAVSGRSIAGENADVATAKIKGPPGTKVTITVVGHGGHARRELTLERENIRLPVARGGIRHVDGEKVGYVRFIEFAQGAHAQLRRVVKSVERRGAKGLVLDLRGNGGGLLPEAVLCASIFVLKGEVVVSTSGRHRPHTVLEATGYSLPPRPTVILIDRHTASAAEIFTAALEDHHLATVVGQRSFGKGVFQQVIDLPNNGALKLTVGEYLTANGTSLAGHGIKAEVPARDLLSTRHTDEGLLKALAVLGLELARSR